MVMRTRLGAVAPFAPAFGERAVVFPAGIAERVTARAAERRSRRQIQILVRKMARFWLRGAPLIGIQVIYELQQS
jgi:hypothetical protein